MTNSVITQKQLKEKERFGKFLSQTVSERPEAPVLQGALSTLFYIIYIIGRNFSGKPEISICPETEIFFGISFGILLSGPGSRSGRVIFLLMRRPWILFSYFGICPYSLGFIHTDSRLAPGWIPDFLPGSCFLSKHAFDTQLFSCYTYSN